MKWRKRIRTAKNRVIYSSPLHNRFYSVHKLRRLSYVVSYRKSGRTWVRTILVHYIGKKSGSIDQALPFSTRPDRTYREFMRNEREIVFMHDFNIPGINEKGLASAFMRSPYRIAPTVFLLRDPRDVVISYYHHLRDRALNRDCGARVAHFSNDMGIDEFVCDNLIGIAPVIDYYNQLAEFSRNYGRQVRFFAYEDLRGHDGEYDIDVWQELLGHVLRRPIDEEALKWALEVNRFDQLKERNIAYKNAIPMRHPATQGRVRSGRIGGFHAELQEETVRYCDNLIDASLDGFYSRYRSRNDHDWQAESDR